MSLLRLDTSRGEDYAAFSVSPQISDKITEIGCSSIEAAECCNTPQLIDRPDGKVTLIQPAPPIRRLVLGGGGARGAVYPAFVKTLDEQSPFLKGLSDIAGSSAGALMAILMAAGLSTDEIQEQIDATPMLDLLNGGMEGQDLQLAHGGWYQAGNLINRLSEVTRDEACQYCDEAFQANMESLLEGVDPEAQERFKEHVNSRFEKGLTFEDLDILHQLEPEKFKRLHVTGYERAENETDYYNSQSSPNMLIHHAVRISMAIPRVTKPINHEGRILSDGGQGSNLPIEAFEKANPEERCDPETTLALVFDDGGASHVVLHNPAKKINNVILRFLLMVVCKIIELVTCFFKFIFRIKDDDDGWHGPKPPLLVRLYLGAQFTRNHRNDQIKAWELGVNVAVVPHDGLGILSFKASPAKIERARESARCGAREYAEQRVQHATYAVFDSAEEALESLSPEESRLHST